MEWSSLQHIAGSWAQQISNIEAKQLVAKKLAERLQPGDVVGVGSGSTAFLTIQALAVRSHDEEIPFVAIPTSQEVGLACASLNIPTSQLSFKRPDWSFDGCDEVDREHNMIKGRGGAMFREKMLMASCGEIYIVADNSKLVEKLGSKFPVPLEVHPDALPRVIEIVQSELKATKAHVRPAINKDGPIITESGNLIVDANFSLIEPGLDQQLIAIPGVIETGLFCGFEFELITG